MYFKRFIFDKDALKTSYGSKLYKEMQERGLSPEIRKGKESIIEGDNPQLIYREGKRTLLIGSRSPSKFENCRPSAHYQLPITSGCPGLCEYCYLMTRTGENSYIKLNSNLEHIYEMINKYIKEGNGNKILFELSASSDPVPFEEPTEIVSTMINYFGNKENTGLRICTKFEPTESILTAKHNNNTDFRFSMNTPYVIDSYEHSTPSLDRRIIASKKIYEANYKLGIMIAPVFIYDNWKDDYSNMLDKIEAFLGDNIVSFEVVTHRYTNKARETIQKIFPETTLDMEDENRKFKMGQFGYGKYVYSKDNMNIVKEFFAHEIEKKFPSAKLLYVV